MTDIPDRIFLSPEDAAQFSRKYGHEKLTLVCVGDPYVEYTRVPQWSTDMEAAKEAGWIMTFTPNTMFPDQRNLTHWIVMWHHGINKWVDGDGGVVWEEGDPTAWMPLPDVEGE